MSEKGSLWPGESAQTTDQSTGAAVWQITNHPSINHTLYFLANSFLPDERSLVFASFRTGTANFFRADFPSGNITQLTNSSEINSFSAVISHDGETLYFTRGPQFVALRLADLREEVLATFPGGRLGEVHLSPDGQWLVSALRMGRAFGIALTAAHGGGGAIIHHEERVIIHPQFHPYDPGLIEYACDPAPRMHLIRRDGTGNRCLHEHGNDDFLVHETWLGDTGDLVFVHWPKAIKRLSLPSGHISTVSEFNAWHVCPSADGESLICDTNHPDIGLQYVEVASGRRQTACFPGSSNGGSQWPKGRYALQADFEAAAQAAGGSPEQQASWFEMKTDTVYGPQWTHPHPALSDSGHYATFTSDRSGHPQVYVVRLAGELIPE